MKEDKGRTPLRIILNNFLNHIEKLEAQRSPDDSYEKEFQDLKLFSENLKGVKQYASAEGEKEVNRKKNRYKDILPFDFSRVILSEYAGTAGSDYINANFIKGASGSPAYIASQGPLVHTVNDFWRMVVECEVHVIIMACNEDEAGKHKCEKYWVDREGEIKQFGMVRIRLLQGSDVCPDFSVRTIKIEYTNKDSITEERTVCQFHYSAWPDHGVPPSVRPLLDMVRLVRDTQASETLPVLVHCSAGCGRTGTICAIDYVWGLLRAGKLTKDFSLLTLVRDMRRQRVAMVQTTEQYILVHRAVRELFREQLRVIDSHPYENIDVDGVHLHKGHDEPLYESICVADATQLSGKVLSPSDDSTPAPPLPRKNRVHLASKQEKEVENRNQKQRNSHGGSGGIAKLKAMFERSPVSRSQSLGRRQASNPVPTTSSPANVKTPPALPIKRSKSLRILGSGERGKLSLSMHQDSKPTTSSAMNKSKPSAVKSKPAQGTLVRRRRSFDSNSSPSPKPVRRSLHLDDDGRRLLQDCKDFLAGTVESPLETQRRIDSIVAGLGVRERRDSFRQAISKQSDIKLNDAATSAPMHTSRSYTNQRDQNDVDEVDGSPMQRQHSRNLPHNHPDMDVAESALSNVIVVKPDRLSPKPDLYVRSLPGEKEKDAPNCTRHPKNMDSDPLKQIGLIWSRAATSIDLKNSLCNNDLTLQELKSCLRREGTAHELKRRKEESGYEKLSYPVKLYKSLDRMTKKDESPQILSSQPSASERRPAPLSAMTSPHRSPQTTVDRRNPLNASSSPHRSPQTTVDRRNPLNAAPSPHRSPQTTVDRRNPLNGPPSPHRSPQTTTERRNPLNGPPSPHRSPQTTVDRRNPLSGHGSPHHSPQTTVDRRHPLTSSLSPHHSPQTTVDRRNPLTAPSSPHHSPQTTVDRRNPMNTVSSPHSSPQTTVDRRNPLTAASSPHHSPQTTVDRRNPLHSHSPQATMDRGNPLNQPSSPLRISELLVDRRNHINPPQHSPQASVDRRIPMNGIHPSPHGRTPLTTQVNSHRSPQATGEHRNPPVSGNTVSGPPPLMSTPTVSHQTIQPMMNAIHARKNGPHQSPIAVDQRNPIVNPGVNNQQSVQLAVAANSHRTRRGSGPGPGPTLAPGSPSEPYSYGLVASVLRRGSQDDLALCMSGGINNTQKLTPNAQRPNAPPRIKRHASVVLPRKTGGSKDTNATVNSNSHGDSEKWVPKGLQNSTHKQPYFQTKQPQQLTPTSTGPVLAVCQPQPVSSSSSPHAQPAVQTSNQPPPTTKSRSSPKKSAASSLSRALGALQLRRSHTSSSSSPKLSSANSQNVEVSAAHSVVTSATLSTPTTTLSPTLVVTPSKPVLPSGILDVISKAPHHLLRAPPPFPARPGHQPIRRHPHPHPHPQAQSSPLHPPSQPYQHRHPFPSARHPHPQSLQQYTAPAHHVYPQHPPHTHKKQQYL